jgi:transposase
MQGELRRQYAGVLRRFHVFAAPKQDAEHTYESLVRAFRLTGGSVKTVLVDNQKAAVLKNSNGNVVFNAENCHTGRPWLPAAGMPPLAQARTKGRLSGW